MAREETTTEELERLANKVSGIGTAMVELVDELKANNVPSVRLHLAMLTKRLIPSIEHWLDVALLNAKEDVRAYLLGMESQSAIQHRYDQNRKRAAAKKGIAKSTTKASRAASKKTT